MTARLTWLRRFAPRLAAAGLGALLAAACASPPREPRLPVAGVLAPREVRVQQPSRGRAQVASVPLEEYVAATVISEFAPAAGELDAVERMMEVQAVISRTYAASHLARHGREGFDLCSTTHCQLYEPGRLRVSRWSTAVTTAVSRTTGAILTFDRRPAQALFHADCGGHTSAASEVWRGDDRPYLLARPDRTGGEPHVSWKHVVTLEALSKALAADPATVPVANLRTIEVAGRDAAGRAAEVQLGDKAGRAVIVRGDEFRQILSRAFGVRAIRSTWFEVRLAGSIVTFTGRGFGHGVGLCQAGAYARIRAGARPVDVLRHYFPGTEVSVTR